MGDKRFVLPLRDPEFEQFRDPNYIKKTFYGKAFYMGSQITAVSLAMDSELNGSEYKVLLFLIGNMNFQNNVVMPQAFIAEKLSMTQAQVSKTLKKLIEMMYIEKTLVSGNNAYHIEDFVAKKGKVKK